MLKQTTGRKAKPSMRECAPQPAIAAAPKALMFFCTTTLAMEMMQLERPEGTPLRRISRSSQRWKRMRSGYTR